jgi:alpha-1,3/alpha-1,6-mannosyltransferase
MSSSQKDLLLAAKNNVALLYTPMYEHFGIVPLEAMASGLPVIATNSGGPTETIVDAGLPSPAESSSSNDNPSTSSTTGLLRRRDPTAWATALSALLALSPSQRAAIGEAGKARVKEHFSGQKLGEEMEKACQDAASVGYPIAYEVGFKKMLVAGFMSLGAGASLPPFPMPKALTLTDPPPTALSIVYIVRIAINSP